MTSEVGQFETIPTTMRTAEFLARKHGFESLQGLAENLPPEAKVIDVGAGASPFGMEVAQLRPDIKWVNFDLSYNDPLIFEEASKNAPDNIELVTGDATKLNEAYEPESFDAAFSYWLFPHLSLYSKTPAREAARNMHNITKYGGYLSIGPARGEGPVSSHLTTTTDKTTKDNSADEIEFADKVLDKTRLKGVRLILQRINNEVADKMYDSTLHMKKTPGFRAPKVLVPGTKEYRNPAHPRVVLSMLRAEIYLAQAVFAPGTYSRVRD